MGAGNWALLRDRNLAQSRGDAQEVEKQERALAAHRAGCAHVEHPEKPGICIECDAPMAPELCAKRPGVRKTSSTRPMRKAS